MIPPLDPFAEAFDSIEIDPARAPSRAAIEGAMQRLAAPGFYLLNDAEGRFVVDRDMGVVSLADAALLDRERGAVHAVRLRVVEQSGESYEMEMQLRVTGRVPQMIGAEDFAALAAITDETVLAPQRMPALVAPAAPAQPAPAAEIPAPADWTRFSAAHGHIARAPRLQPRRSFILAEAPATDQTVTLAFDGPPQSFSAHLPWSL
jgi:hypothetical protein